MNPRIQLLVRAARDIQTTLRWLHERSPTGALHWYEALIEVLDAIVAAPEQYASPAEAEPLQRPDLREAFFATPHGRNYRVIFRVAPNGIIRVLRVRGPGQRPMKRRDLRA